MPGEARRCSAAAPVSRTTTSKSVTRRDSAARRSGAVQGAQRPRTVSRQASKERRGCRRSVPGSAASSSAERAAARSGRPAPVTVDVAMTGPDSIPARAAAAAIPARWGLIPNNLAPGGVLPSLTRLFGGR